MSEYQYCEFLAIDQPLTTRQIDTLRSYSTRANITSTGFINDYSWGSFKGDEDKWMEKYFDAFLYTANWGERTIQFRLPTSLLDPKVARQYCSGRAASTRQKDGKTIISFFSDDETGGEWVETENCLAGIVPVRSQLAMGDYRALYLGWLLCAQSEDLDDGSVEPPIPPGLRKLSASLKQFADFLRIDEDWLHVAASTSQLLNQIKPNRRHISTWLAEIPTTKKDQILFELMLDNKINSSTKLLQQYLKDKNIRNNPRATEKRRTVKELREAVEILTIKDIAV